MSTARTDLEGLTVEGEGGVASVNGTPEEDAAGCNVLWSYGGAMMLTTLAAGLTGEQVAGELRSRMASIEAARQVHEQDETGDEL